MGREGMREGGEDREGERENKRRTRGVIGDWKEKKSEQLSDGD